MKGLDELFIVAWMLFGILLTPLFFIAFDLWAGIRKAKQRCEKISSDGWKRTVNKVARYYNALLALVVVDCMQMAGVWYLDNYYDYHIPIFEIAKHKADPAEIAQAVVEYMNKSREEKK